MTLVAEVRKLDDAFDERSLARLIVLPDGAIDVLELQPGGAAVARVLLDEVVVDPFGRSLARTDGPDFLKALRWDRSSDRLWITTLVDLPVELARDPGVPLPEPVTASVAATIPYPEPPIGLAGIRVAEVRSPDPDDYTRSEVLARLVAGPDGPLVVEGPDAVSVGVVRRLLDALEDPSLDQLEGVTLAPSLVLVPAPFDRPGDEAWRNALVGARRAALADGDDATLARLDLEYQTRLPRIWLSRCPFTGDVLRLAIDAWGFDGPFWDPASPVRPMDELPATFLGLAGGVGRLGDQDDDQQIPAEALGSGRPPLFPLVADHPDVRAVLSATTVGGRRCDLVAYFARPRPTGPPLFREWGTRLARILDGSDWHWIAGPSSDPPVETDLVPWLAQGRLAWIEPFDMGVELRTGSVGCPWIEPAAQSVDTTTPGAP